MLIRTAAFWHNQPYLPFLFSLPHLLEWFLPHFSSSESSSSYSSSHLAVVVDCLDGVVSLVVADKEDFTIIVGPHQRHNLPCRPHKRLACAHELDLAGWVDHPHHSSSLGIEQHPIADPLPLTPTQDGYFVGVKLREDWEPPRREAWDIDDYPCLCPHP